MERVGLDHTIIMANLFHGHRHMGHILEGVAMDAHRIHCTTCLCFADETACLRFLQRIL